VKRSFITESNIYKCIDETKQKNSKYNIAKAMSLPLHACIKNSCCTEEREWWWSDGL